MITRSPSSRDEWNSIVAQLPGAHILQSWEWGKTKSHIGWGVNRVFWQAAKGGPVVAAAQILRRRIRVGPLSVAVFYVPKGPLLAWQSAAVREPVLGYLETLARQEHAIQIKIDPDLILGLGTPGTADETADMTGRDITGLLKKRRWRFSAEQIQFRNTVMLDIRPEEKTLLAGMKQKTRYNIRLAQKHGVTVRPGSEKELPLLYRMYAETAARDGFIIRPWEYYADVWSTLMRSGLAQPLVAEVEGTPVAALILFTFADRGWYFYGMSRDVYRERMPNHLLQWEAIRWLRTQGCSSYDFWGAPDIFSERDALWGVYKFKTGYGAATVRHIGAWDFAPSPLRYAMYHTLLPRMLDLTRAISRRRTRALADSS